MKNWLSITLICTVVVASIYLWKRQPEILSTLAPSDSPFERFPYAVLHDAKTRHFDTQGNLSYEFDAVTLKHFRVDLSSNSDEDYMLLTAPKLTLYGEPEPWRVMAKNGKVTEQGNKLSLWGDVKVWQMQATKAGDGTELTTESIDIYPAQKRLITTDHVHVVSAAGTLDADGLEVDMLSQRIKLLANVRGHHEPIQ